MEDFYAENNLNLMCNEKKGFRHLLFLSFNIYIVNSCFFKLADSTRFPFFLGH